MNNFLAAIVPFGEERTDIKDVEKSQVLKDLEFSIWKVSESHNLVTTVNMLCYIDRHWEIQRFLCHFVNSEECAQPRVIEKIMFSYLVYFCWL